MSDENDEKFHAALLQLIGSYATMGRIFQELPVPVQLPSGMISGDMMRDALLRAAQLAEYQPMPQDQQFQMERACLMWIAADHLLAVFHHADGMEQLAAAAMHCIVVADDSALDLGEWLVTQLKQQE